MVWPATLQTPVVSGANVTASPELAVAINPNGATPSVLGGSVSKVIV